VLDAYKRMRNFAEQVVAE